MAPHPSPRRLRQLSLQLLPHRAAEDSPPPPLPLTQRGLTITDIKCYGVGTRDNGETVMVGHGRNICMVKVETEGGHFGWGESGVVGREVPSPRPATVPPSRRSAVAARGGQVAVMGAVQHYREFLIGKDASRIGALWQEM